MQLQRTLPPTPPLAHCSPTNLLPAARPDPQPYRHLPCIHPLPQELLAAAIKIRTGRLHLDCIRESSPSKIEKDYPPATLGNSSLHQQLVNGH